MPNFKETDGRRNNRPPEDNQIRKGEVRNPNGRRGKARKVVMSDTDSLYLEAGRQIVSRDDSGDVSAIKRLIQEEYYSALAEKNPQARARLLRTLTAIDARKASECREFMDWFLPTKTYYEEQFRRAEVSRTLAPNCMHPSHVHMVGREVVHTGPVDAEGRRAWEDLKALIRICAFVHERARKAQKDFPSDANLAELRRVEKRRRLLMRQVPKGWKWNEEIYCRYSREDFVRKTISRLEEVL